MKHHCINALLTAGLGLATANTQGADEASSSGASPLPAPVATPIPDRRFTGDLVWKF